MAANTTSEHNEIRTAALAALAHQLCPIPIRDDGTKAPALPTWKQYQYRMPTEEEVRRWFANPRHGLALLGGTISGNLECLDFDEPGLLHRFAERCQQAGLGGVLTRIGNGFTEETPRGGHHLVYRVDGGPVPGNKKLAERPVTEAELAESDDKRKTLIETRGEGGYFVAAPTNGWVHPTGRPWQLLRGGFDHIATIGRDERDRLVKVARQLDQIPPPDGLRDTSSGSSSDRPGDLYDVAPDAHERTLGLLLAHGWQEFGREGGKVYLTRPGKGVREGKSASLGHHHPGHLHVFSSSAHPFEPERSYSPFQVYAHLEYGGDFKAAARALHAQQTGQQPGAGPRQTAESGTAEKAEPARRVVLVPASSIRIERARWVAKGRIPLAATTLVVGIGGLGKSTYLLDWAADVTNGTLEGDLYGEPRDALIASAEDAPKYTVVPRLKAAGADVNRVHFIKVAVGEDDDGLIIPDDLDALADAAVTVGAAFIVIDPLVEYLTDRVDSHKDHHVRRALGPIARLAERTGASVLPVIHLNKQKAADLYTRVSGSTGFFNAARSVLLVAEDPTPTPGETEEEPGPPDPAGRVLVHGKCNLAPLAPTWRFRIVGTDVIGPDGPVPTSQIVWGEETDAITPGTALGPPSREDDAEERNARAEAKGLLQELLGGGDKVERDLILREWRKASGGASERTLQRAKRELGVKHTREGVGTEQQTTYWHIPSRTTERDGKEPVRATEPVAASPHVTGAHGDGGAHGGRSATERSEQLDLEGADEPPLCRLCHERPGRLHGGGSYYCTTCIP